MIFILEILLDVKKMKKLPLSKDNAPRRLKPSALREIVQQAKDSKLLRILKSRNPIPGYLAQIAR
jgi:hypothetical protein